MSTKATWMKKRTRSTLDKFRLEGDVPNQADRILELVTGKKRDEKVQYCIDFCDVLSKHPAFKHFALIPFGIYVFELVSHGKWQDIWKITENEEKTDNQSNEEIETKVIGLLNDYFTDQPAPIKSGCSELLELINEDIAEIRLRDNLLKIRKNKAYLILEEDIKNGMKMVLESISKEAKNNAIDSKVIKNGMKMVLEYVTKEAENDVIDSKVIENGRKMVSEYVTKEAKNYGADTRSSFLSARSVLFGCTVLFVCFCGYKYYFQKNKPQSTA